MLEVESDHFGAQIIRFRPFSERAAEGGASMPPALLIQDWRRFIQLEPDLPVDGGRLWCRRLTIVQQAEARRKDHLLPPEAGGCSRASLEPPMPHDHEDHDHQHGHNHGQGGWSRSCVGQFRQILCHRCRPERCARRDRGGLWDFGQLGRGSALSSAALSCQKMFISN